MINFHKMNYLSPFILCTTMLRPLVLTRLHREEKWGGSKLALLWCHHYCLLWIIDHQILMLEWFVKDNYGASESCFGFSFCVEWWKFWCSFLGKGGWGVYHFESNIITRSCKGCWLVAGWHQWNKTTISWNFF